jgi:hypothetical protein
MSGWIEWTLDVHVSAECGRVLWLCYLLAVLMLIIHRLRSHRFRCPPGGC